MRRFYLQRDLDASGVSGIGRVADGVVFANGWVAMTWLGQIPSIVFYSCIADVETIHGHHGTTTIVFVDEADDDQNQNPRASPLVPASAGCCNPGVLLITPSGSPQADWAPVSSAAVGTKR